MKNLVILLLMLLPHLGVAANCKSFEIANEAIPPTMLDYTINNNAACKNKHNSGLVWGKGGYDIVKLDANKAKLGLKTVASWEGWYHYYISDHPHASEAYITGTVDHWTTHWST